MNKKPHGFLCAPLGRRILWKNANILSFWDLSKSIQRGISSIALGAMALGLFSSLIIGLIHDADHQPDLAGDSPVR